MAKNKFPGKRQGVKVNTEFACGECKKTTIRELDEIIGQLNRHRTPDDQVVITEKLRTLLQHLEQGEVHYVTAMAVPSAMENKPAEVVTTLRTFLKGEEKLWVLCHKDKKSYVWKASYKSVGGKFPDFYIHSCDTLVMA